MCSMQIVGVCGTFCMETDKILIPKHLHCLGFQRNIDIYMIFTFLYLYMYDFL